mmetsp:Transcript_5348/g.8044  ORF Transcript_5348/g.8044 Transcript_5348/m.8044 type:complete len:393 (+) Transcript_5348:734-1912(+)
MGGSILTDSNGIVREDPCDGNFHDGRETNDGLHVVRKYEETRSERAQLGQAHSIHDGSHSVLTDTKVEVASGPVAPACGGGHEISILGVGQARLGGGRKIRRSSEEVRASLGNELHNLSVGNTRRHTLLVGGVSGQAGLPALRHLTRVHEVDLSSKIWEFRLVLSKGGFPFLACGSPVGLHLSTEVVVDTICDVKSLVFWKAVEFLAGGNLGISQRSSVGTVGILLVGGSPGNVRIDDDQSRAVRLALSDLESVLKLGEVVGVRDASDIPAVGDESGGDVLSKGPVGVTLNRNMVIVPDPAKVVQLQVTGKGGSLGLDTLLEATVSGQGVCVEVEHFKTGLVVGSSEPLGGNCHTDGSGKTISKRSSSSLNSRSPVIFGVTGASRMELAESL